MSYEVSITPGAEESLEELLVWWGRNRTSANPLSNELANIELLLGENPGIGALYKQHGSFTARRIRLGVSPYYLYYSVEMENRKVLILAAWSAMQNEGPPN